MGRSMVMNIPTTSVWTDALHGSPEMIMDTDGASVGYSIGKETPQSRVGMRLLVCSTPGRESH
jgi:hypothetical protein